MLLYSIRLSTRYLLKRVRMLVLVVGGMAEAVVEVRPQRMRFVKPPCWWSVCVERHPPHSRSPSLY